MATVALWANQRMIRWRYPPDADGYAPPHSLQRKPQRMSDHIIPFNADDASTDPRSVYVQPLIQPQRTTTYTQPAAYTRPAYGRQPAMPQAAAPQTVAPQTFGMPPQAAPRQSRPNSRFSYPPRHPLKAEWHMDAGSSVHVRQRHQTVLRWVSGIQRPVRQT